MTAEVGYLGLDSWWSKGLSILHSFQTKYYSTSFLGCKQTEHEGDQPPPLYITTSIGCHCVVCRHTTALPVICSWFLPVILKVLIRRDIIWPYLVLKKRQTAS